MKVYDPTMTTKGIILRLQVSLNLLKEIQCIEHLQPGLSLGSRQTTISSTGKIVWLSSCFSESKRTGSKKKEEICHFLPIS